MKSRKPNLEVAVPPPMGSTGFVVSPRNQPMVSPTTAAPSWYAPGSPTMLTATYTTLAPPSPSMQYSPTGAGAAVATSYPLDEVAAAAPAVAWMHNPYMNMNMNMNQPVLVMFPGVHPATVPSPRVCDPGPPIQTTSAPQGPPGCNLFIFHIPNEFTNVDLFKLFSVYGNPISVRIMVETGTGRGRGFGFVSYDNTASAQAAIAALDGAQFGQKRLKVELKKDRNATPKRRTSRARPTPLTAEDEEIEDRSLTSSLGSVSLDSPSGEGVPAPGHSMPSTPSVSGSSRSIDSVPPPDAS